MRGKFVLLAVSLGWAAALPAQALKVYTEDAPPLGQLGPDGKPTGLAVEIVMEIQRRVGNKDPVALMPWARAVADLEARDDVLLIPTGRTAERDKKYQWIGPIYESAFSLYSLSDSPLRLRSLEEAKKVGSIGVYRGDVRDQILTAAGLTNLYRVADEVTLAKLLFGRRVDLVASSDVGMKAIVELIGERVENTRLQFVFSRTQLYVAASKGMPTAVVKAWNAALDAMKKDGTFRRLFEKYKLLANIPGPAITKFD